MFIENLIKLLKINNISSQTLEKIVGKRLEKIWEYYNGECGIEILLKSIDLHTVIKICKIFNLDFNTLLGDVNSYKTNRNIDGDDGNGELANEEKSINEAKKLIKFTKPLNTAYLNATLSISDPYHNVKFF